MKQHIADLIHQAIDALKTAGEFDSDLVAHVQIDNTRDKQHGDLACNVALTLAKVARRKPRDIALLICQHLPQSDSVTKTEIAGPGFINFFISQDATQAVIGRVLSEAEKFGRNHSGAGHKVQVEFVSANPTGPLHVGHGRGAAYGASLSNLLETAGFQVEREYYVNDAGRQMDILAASVWLRYLQLAGTEVVFPSNGYQGDYVNDIAQQLHQQAGDRLKHSTTAVMADLHADAPAGDKEKHVDDLIVRAKSLLGEADYDLVFDAGLNSIRDDIKHDLHGFGVDFDQWFSERT